MKIKASIQICYWKLSNLCRLIFLLLLLLLLCNCVVATTTKLYIKHMLLCNCVVATTTKLHIKNNKNKKINLHKFSVQLSITQLQRQITGRNIYVRCAPSRGIWWPGLVLHQVSLTFTVRYKVSLTCTVRHTQLRCTPPHPQ